MGFLGKIGGRKFLVALLGLISVVVFALTGVDIEPYRDPIMLFVGGYLGAQGFADGMSKGATSSTQPDNAPRVVTNSSLNNGVNS